MLSLLVTSSLPGLTEKLWPSIIMKIVVILGAVVAALPRHRSKLKCERKFFYKMFNCQSIE